MRRLLLLWVLVVAVVAPTAAHAGDLLDAIRESPQAAVQRPRLLVYTAPWCPGCPVLKADIGTKLDAVFDVEYVTDIPDWVVVLPTVHWQDRPGHWTYLRPTEAVPLTYANVKAAVMPPPQEFNATAEYPIGMSNRRWTYGPERTIMGHLLGGNHKFTPAELKGFSRDELIRIHNYEHQNHRPRATQWTPGETKVAEPQASTRRRTVWCPT